MGGCANGSCSTGSCGCSECAAKLVARMEKAMGSHVVYDTSPGAGRRPFSTWGQGGFAPNGRGGNGWPGPGLRFTGYVRPNAVDGGTGMGAPAMPPPPPSAPMPPIAAPMRAASASSVPSNNPVLAMPVAARAPDYSIRPQKGFGAIPGGWTQQEWATLTPEQQSAVLKADRETQNQIREAVVAGARSAVDLITKAIDSAERAADRANATEIEKIRAKLELDKAKLQAQTQIELAKLGITTPTPDGTKSGETAPPTPVPEKTDNTMLYVVGGLAVVGVAYLATRKGGRKAA